MGTRISSYLKTHLSASKQPFAPVSGTCQSTPPSVTMAMLLSVFKNTPLPTSLALSNATPPVPSEVEKLPDPQEVVNLPHLQSLRITPDAIPTANFLRHISYPALTTTNIDFPEVDCEQMAPGHFGDDLGNSIPQNLRYVSLRADRTGFYLYGWVEPEQDIDLRARTVSAPYAIRMFCENEDIDRCQTTCWIYSCMVSKVIHEALEVVHLDLDLRKKVGKMRDVLSVPWSRCGEVDYKRITRLVHTLEIRTRDVSGIFEG